jgi:hypothetical protein
MGKKEAQQHILLFICGLHKSGTSLFHEILRSHPRISGFRNTGVAMDEGQFLQSVFPPAYVYGGQGRFGFHPEMHMTEAHPDARKETAEKLFNEWSGYWDLSLPFLVEKSPPNILRMRFLQVLFPASRFLIVLRHPVVVAEATGKTVKLSVSRLIEHTLHCYELMEQDLPKIRNYYMLRYEDLCRTPWQLLDDVFAWLGAGKFTYDRKIVPDVNSEYFKLWQRRKKSRFFRMKNTRHEQDFENRMNRFGYSAVHPETLTDLLLPKRKEETSA